MGMHSDTAPASPPPEPEEAPLDTAHGLADGALAHLAERVAACTPACCGVTATASAAAGGPGTPTAVTHPDLAPLAAVQWDSGEGPVPEALATGRPAAAEDLLREERWPHYRVRALRSGIRSTLTLPFRREGLAVTLTLHGFRPGLLGDAVNGTTLLLGDLATTGLARDRHYRAMQARVDQLGTALRTRPVVDRACGILMHVLDCDADEALALLRRTSQHSNRKLSELAETLVRTRGRGVERELLRWGDRAPA